MYDLKKPIPLELKCQLSKDKRWKIGKSVVDKVNKVTRNKKKKKKFEERYKKWRKTLTRDKRHI